MRIHFLFSRIERRRNVACRSWLWRTDADKSPRDGLSFYLESIVSDEHHYLPWGSALHSTPNPTSCPYVFTRRVQHLAYSPTMYRQGEALIISSLYSRFYIEACNEWRDHLRDLASGQHSSEETSQWWRAVGDSVSALTESKISHTYTSPFFSYCVLVK